MRHSNAIGDNWDHTSGCSAKAHGILSLLFQKHWLEMDAHESTVGSGTVFWDDCVTRRTSQHPTEFLSWKLVVWKGSVTKTWCPIGFAFKGYQSRTACSRQVSAWSVKDFYQGNPRAISVTEMARKIATALRLSWLETVGFWWLLEYVATQYPGTCD